MLEYNDLVLDIQDEQELYLRIENQLKNLGNNYLEIDYLDFYAKKIVGMPDYEPLNNFELYIKDDYRPIYEDLIKRIKLLFNIHMGFNMFNSNDEDMEFETIYNIYNTFMLNAKDTFAKYIIGLSVYNDEDAKNMPKNEFFTLKSALNEFKIKNSLEKNIEENSNESITSIIRTTLSRENVQDKDFDNSKLINSGHVFKILYKRAFFNENWFNERPDLLHKILETIISVDENEIYKYLLFKLYAFEYSIEQDEFCNRYEPFFLNEANIDAIESIYRQKYPILIKNLKETNNE